MNIHLLKYLAIIPFALSCTKPTATSNLSGSYQSRSIDALTFSQSLVDAPAPCRFHLMNLFSDALSDGLLRNGALTGLGTDYPTGKKLKTDSLYFQAVRIASIFDWEMGTRLSLQETGCLPEDVGFQLGTFPMDYLQNLQRPFPSDVAKIKKIAGHVNDDLKEFEVVSLEAHESIEAWPRVSSYPLSQQKALFQGIQDKLAFTREALTQTKDEAKRLRAYAASYNPLALTFQGQFKGGTRARFYAEAYLPPLMELNTDDWDDLFSWQLTRGIKKHALKRPANISVGLLTHISYLTEGDPLSQPMIKFQMLKDFAKPDEILTRIVFGRLDLEGMEGGPIPMNYKNYRDAFYVSFYPNLSSNDKDPDLVKGLKKQFNEIANQIKIDARIHQLTLRLERAPVPATGDADSSRLTPHFSLKESDISFRMHRFTSDPLEIKSLQALSFQCLASDGGSQTDCFYDFGAYSDLRDFVLDGSGLAQGKMNSPLARSFRSLLNTVTRLNVKFIVDWNMKQIESAIDQELMSILDEIVDDQADNRKKIQERLEKRLFPNEP